MAKKGPRKTTPEEWARWRANERRREELANRGLAQLGITEKSSIAGSASLRRP